MRLSEDAPKRILLDLKAVEFLDSSGLGAVVAAIDTTTGDFRWREAYTADREGTEPSFGVQSNLLLKDETGGALTVVALEGEDVDKMLYTALAKGADRALKVTGAGAPGRQLQLTTR